MIAAAGPAEALRANADGLRLVLRDRRAVSRKNLIALLTDLYIAADQVDAWMMRAARNQMKEPAQ